MISTPYTLIWAPKQTSLLWLTEPQPNFTRNVCSLSVFKWKRSTSSTEMKLLVAPASISNAATRPSMVPTSKNNLKQLSLYKMKGLPVSCLSISWFEPDYHLRVCYQRGRVGPCSEMIRKYEAMVSHAVNLHCSERNLLVPPYCQVHCIFE